MVHRLTQAEMLRASHDSVSYRQVPPDAVECCGLAPGASIVSSDSCFHEFHWQWLARTLGTAPKAYSRSDRAVSVAPDLMAIRTVMDLGTFVRRHLCKESEFMITGPGVEIPRRIVQTGITKELRLMNRMVQYGVISWLVLNPCYDYIFLDEADVTKLLGSFPLEYAMAYTGLSNSGEKDDFAR